MKIFFGYIFFINKNSIYNQKKLKKKFFRQNSKSWFVYFTETEKAHSGNSLKII